MPEPTAQAMRAAETFYDAPHVPMDREDMIAWIAEHIDKATRLPALIEALGALVRFNEADPHLYDGDDDGVLGRLMYAARAALRGRRRE